MPKFKAIIMKSGVENVTTRDKGIVISVDPECRLSLVAEDGDPHDLAQRLAAIQGKRVVVTIEREQPDLEFEASVSVEHGDDGGDLDFSEDETGPSPESVEADRMRELAQAGVAEAEVDPAAAE